MSSADDDEERKSGEGNNPGSVNPGSKRRALSNEPWNFTSVTAEQLADEMYHNSLGHFAPLIFRQIALKRLLERCVLEINP